MDFSKSSRRALRKFEHEKRQKDAADRQESRRRKQERKQRKNAEKARLAREILVVPATATATANDEGEDGQTSYGNGVGIPAQSQGNDQEGVKQLKDAGGKLSSDVLKVLRSDDDAGASGGGEPSSRKRQRQDRLQRSVDSKMWRHFDRKDAENANPFFATYYQQQLDMSPDGEDWNQLAATLASNLKVTFRLNRGRHPLTAAALDARLRNEFQFRGSFVRVGVDQILASGEVVKPSPWSRDLWQLGTDRIGFSKAKTLEPLYETLRREASLGHLARQGIASMLPAMVLRPRQGQTILDMCGAPGSKSEQVLQMVGPTGALVTNDSDPKRLDSVFRRLKHVGHTNHVVICSRGQDLAQHAGANVFDGIICDVPCSGDGTTRKYPHLWRRWRPRHGVQLHDLQLDLAKSAASLLKVGGRMVYSTCALNPVEDEAVVAALLEAAGGALRLVKIDLGAFRTRAGIESWTIDDEMANAGLDRPEDEHVDGSNADSRESKPARKRARKGRKGKGQAPEPVTVTPTMLPPLDARRTRKLNLPYCARVLPHDNDTEGFFLALIEKVADWDLVNEFAKRAPAEQRASDSKELLSKLGFNPRIAADAKLPKLAFLDDPPKKILDALRDQVGISAKADAHRDVRFRKLAARDESVDKRYKAVMMSNAAAAVVDAKWAASGSVPVLRAGVEVAHLRSTSTGMAFCALPQAGLALADTLLGDMNSDDEEDDATPKFAAELPPHDMMALLQVVMASMNNDSDIEDGSASESDDGGDGQDAAKRRRGKAAARGPPVLEIGQLAVVLEDEDIEDDEDLELCQHPASNLLVDSSVGANLVLALRPFEITTSSATEDSEAAASANEAVEAGSKRRMSKAERKKLKKQNKSQSSSAKTVSSSKATTKPSQTGSEPPSLVDMFASTPKPAFEMVIQLRKISPSHVEVVTDYSRILSYGLTLQHHLSQRA
ncbi:tRNA cytosine34-C5-methyltransferase [Hondaea fermentalgiana]|uniref:tRNA cytosine34-C5-methyltransferase n=1 Tax=Hondaea fermentalgiana TaxID=2315210 RepID=A0A2R5G3U8_9STRA|nr:tRNA cytosine34-C5-methyltransferase [Hondaea fermentalgiana]|eukprot:GBG24999.1 tRNA cytosine34-C5-methyltransferase [Hondaea fermentalgiana]